MTDVFERNEKLGIYAQFYNFAADEKTKKPNGTIEYQIVRNGSDKPVLDYTEDINSIKGSSAQQVTVEKLLPLQSLEPGMYSLKMKVTDKSTNQVLTPAANFTIK
jgi:cell division protein YceG involved in septum cleavage